LLISVFSLFFFFLKTGFPFCWTQATGNFHSSLKFSYSD